ncbi:MAG: hypothetical protein K0Q55_2269 [Verrucomicrobia bacterium]|nr:hypothetical protein [Verrucomicrobiota bacterium]
MGESRRRPRGRLFSLVERVGFEELRRITCESEGEPPRFNRDMKKHLLILLLALSVVTTATAQVATNSTPSPWRLTKRDLTLQPGALTNVVEQLEALYKPAEIDEYNGPQSYFGMNLIWSPGTAELPVPTALRLSNVEPIDALSLAAAAAGCKLETIESTQVSRRGFVIVGYKIVRMETGMGRMSTVTPVMAGVPGMPGGAMGGSTSNLRELQDELVRQQQRLGAQHPNIVELKRELETAKKIVMERPMTRVYAMGGIIIGNKEEQAVKLTRIMDFISLTLNGEEIDMKGVKVNYHDGTNVLVVRAPEAAQELVGQLIEALRENARTDSSIPKPRR